MSYPQTGAGGIHVSVQFFPLAFLFLACKPVVEINGHPNPAGWGEHYFETGPGRHRVRIYFQYLFQKECGLNSIDVEVPAGGAPCVKYYMWPLVFLPGSISVQA